MYAPNPTVDKGPGGGMLVKPDNIEGYSLTKPSHYLYPSILDKWAEAVCRGESEPGRDTLILAFEGAPDSIVVARVRVQPCCVDKRADPAAPRFQLEVTGDHDFVWGPMVTPRKLSSWYRSKQRKRWDRVFEADAEDAKSFVRRLPDGIGRGLTSYREYELDQVRFMFRPDGAGIGAPASSPRVLRNGATYPAGADQASLLSADMGEGADAVVFLTVEATWLVYIQPACAELRKGPRPTRRPARYRLRRLLVMPPEGIVQAAVASKHGSLGQIEKHATSKALADWVRRNSPRIDKVYETESSEELVELLTPGELDWTDTQMTYPEMYYANPTRRGTYLDRLVEFYGTTSDPLLGGWLLPDGQFLDFSEGSGSRAQDHRNINWVSTVKERPDQSRYDVMARIAKRVGMLRWSPESWGIEAWTPPTPEQYKTMMELQSIQPLTVDANKPTGRKFYGKRFYRQYEQWDPLSLPATELRDFYSGVLDNPVEWSSDVPDLSGPAKYVLAIRDLGDPPELSRKDKGTLEWRAKTSAPVSEWKKSLLNTIKAQDRPRTFHALTIMTAGIGGDTALGKNPEKAIWELTREGKVEHTMQAPILWRPSGSKLEPVEVAVAAMVVRDDDRNILLLQRAASCGWMPGRWNLPMGHVEAGETPKHAALRETREEAGLRVTQLRHLGTVKHGRLVAYFEAERYTGRVRLNEESSDFIWTRDPRELNLVPGLEKLFGERKDNPARAARHISFRREQDSATYRVLYAGEPTEWTVSRDDNHPDYHPYKWFAMHDSRGHDDEIYGSTRAECAAAVAATFGRKDNPGDDADLRFLLSDKSQVASIGPEKGKRVKNGIARYRSPHGSTRYVMYRCDEPISVLQVVSQDGKKAVIANVYTSPTHRSRRAAWKLLMRARKEFEEVVHAQHQTQAGEAWAKAVG